MPSAPSQRLYRPTWAEVDLDAFVRNIDAVRALLPEGAGLIAVLKADAYGHGSVELARRCESGSVAMIAVALLEEALELSDADITLPILILGTLTVPQIELAAQRGFVLGVPGPETLRDVCSVASRTRKDIHIHLKLDSGMGRMGLVGNDLAFAAELLASTPNVRLDAIFTHYANASAPTDQLNAIQNQRFAEMLAELRRLGVSAPLHHRSNSAATMRGLVEPGDLVRVGLSLLGAEPLDEGATMLEPLLTWRSEIVRLKEVPKGESVGYGASFRTTRTSRIATLPVGYADGYNRLLSNKGDVLLRGKRVPIVGRVSMDLVTIDVTDIPEATTGDQAILLGSDGNERISAEELAEKTGTISYEVFCSIAARVPRLYLTERGETLRSRFSTFMEQH